MKIIILFSLLFATLLSYTQSVEVFRDFSFDSTYSLAALSPSFSTSEKDAQKFCFYVNSPADLNDIKKQWTVATMRPKISLEQYAIDLYVVKNKSLVNSELLIFPEQSIIHYGNSWYDFDMKKFYKVQRANPLHYHSQTFNFDTYVDFVFFRDSVQDLPNFLFLFEPTAKRFEGYFYIVSPKSS